MLSHIHIGVTEFEKAFAFYEAVLARLGLEVRFKDTENSWAGWQIPGKDRPLFLIGRPFDGNPASPGNGNMTAFQAPDRAAVTDCHALALKLGGVDEGAPGLRPAYHRDYFGCYFRDPDGNKLCVVCHAPPEG